MVKVGMLIQSLWIHISSTFETFQTTKKENKEKLAEILRQNHGYVNSLVSSNIRMN